MSRAPAIWAVYLMFIPPTSPLFLKMLRRSLKQLGVSLLPNKVGMTVTEVIPAAGEGKVKALYIMGEDPIMSDPDTAHIKHCLEVCDFIVLQEIFPSRFLLPYADVLLPGVTFAEKTGTYTNTERRSSDGSPGHPTCRRSSRRLVDHCCPGSPYPGCWPGAKAKALHTADGTTTEHLRS
jgi:anaerobic selenocysteine-containing dehydrogenase